MIPTINPRTGEAIWLNPLTGESTRRGDDNATRVQGDKPVTGVSPPPRPAAMPGFPRLTRWRILKR